MKKIFRIFNNESGMRGNMLVELLLSVALASLVLPYIFQYHERAIRRAENIAVTKQMEQIQSALERYIVANRTDLLKTVGRNITRVSISDLEQFGVPETVIEQGDEKYQLRILKSSDDIGSATLQGVIVRVSDDISPMRTREIVNLSGGSMGFVDGNHAYGTFGAWHTTAGDLGLGNLSNGIIETTTVNRDSALYLWRLPSDDASDAQMMSALNLGGHDISDIKNLNITNLDCSETVTCGTAAVRELIFKNRTTIDKVFETDNAVVSGRLSSDSKNMEVSGTFSLADTAKLSSLTTDKLWVSNLTLGGLSVDAEDDIAILKINQTLDMTMGRIDAVFVSVGFTGSMTPRLNVYNRIEDPVNSGYYWDVSDNTAKFADATFIELNRMATLATKYNSDKSTYSGQIFGSVSANKNATVSEYMNAINEIQERVRAKYSRLQLQ